MRSAIPPAPVDFGLRRIAILAALPVLALAVLPASSVAAVPHASPTLGATIASPIAKPSPALRIELAGNKKRDDDDNFDPYGKDDPTSKKWGEAAGLGGNRYGGLRTGPEAKKEGKNSDRDDREPRTPRGEDGGK